MFMFTRLYDFRKIHGFTLRECAHIAGISLNSYSRYEKGERVPPVDVIISYCKYYRCSLDYMCGLSDLSGVLSVSEAMV